MDETMQLAEQCFTIGTELAETLLTRLRDTRVIGNAEYKQVMLFFFCKAYKTYQATQILWKKGYVEDAYALARSIYEIRLQVIFMSGDPLPRAKQFMDHLFKCSFGTLQVLRRSDKPDRRSELDTMETNIREAAELTGRADLLQDSDAAERAITKQWWGKGGIKGLLKGLGLEKEYDDIYSQLSDYTHSGNRLLHKFVRLSEDSTIMLCRPAKSESLTLPWGTMDWLSQIAGFTGRAFALDFDEAVASAQEKAKSSLLEHRAKRKKREG